MVIFLNVLGLGWRVIGFFRFLIILFLIRLIGRCLCLKLVCGEFSLGVMIGYYKVLLGW